MPYLAPRETAEALEMLRTTNARVIAGCTDYFPGRTRFAEDETLLDITRLADLRGIEHTSSGYRIGAATSWTDVLRHPLPPGFDALKAAAREVGSVQIQNRATVAGNICNASPAADGVPPLLALDAKVEILSQDRSRIVPLAKFITGVRETALQPGELVSAIHVDPIDPDSKSAFLKLGSRTHLVISIAMVAVNLRLWAGRIDSARIAVGSCSPVAQRLPALEARIIGLDRDAIESFSFDQAGDFDPISPISDIRGSADFRRDAVPELCKRAILRAFGGV